MAKFCAYCVNRLEEEDLFCHECGNRVENLPHSQGEERMSPPPGSTIGM